MNTLNFGALKVFQGLNALLLVGYGKHVLDTQSYILLMSFVAIMRWHMQ